MTILIPNYLKLIPLVEHPDSGFGGSIRAFAKAMGLSSHLDVKGTHKILNTNHHEVKHTIALLMGPNGHALMRTLIIRHKDDTD